MHSARPRRNTRKRQSGVALLVAMFALLLLSAIGMGMMYSANTETDINSNFRDKQVAEYAALAGLQEARDRLAPNGGDIAIPTDFPTTTNNRVIYIVADSTVTPWTAGSKYADTELCQEANLAVSTTLNLTQGASQVRCSGSGALPSGSGWYTSIVDSTGTFHLNPALATKWVRVTLKANNSTPLPVNGTATDSTQVCWSGHNQIPVPGGYNTNCSPGTVGRIKVTNGGINYQPGTTVTLVGGGGSGATAVPTVTIGAISSVNLTGGGSGYTSTPQVVIALPPSGNPADRATATPVMSGSVVLQTINLIGSNRGSGCGNNQTYTLDFSIPAGGTGSGAAGTATTNAQGRVTSVTFTVGGTGYSTVPQVSLHGASCTTSPSFTPQMQYSVASLILGYQGAGYVSSSPPSVTIDPPTSAGGTQATATTTVSPPTITAITVTNGGSGYFTAPTVQIVDPSGSGSGGAATAFLTGGTYFGPVMLVTSLAVTPSGARSMMQMEIAPTVRGVSLPGALTLAGPAGPVSLPVYSGPSGTQFVISGNDENSCGGTVAPSHPAIGAYDDPNNPTYPQTAVEQVIDGIPSGRTGNYTGSSGTTPDVQNVFGAMGEQMSTPSGMEQLASSVASGADVTLSCTAPNYSTGPVGCPITDAQMIAAVNAGGAPMSATNPKTVVVNGDLDISGAFTGYGTLLVTGNMNFSGNFGWNGLVFIIGQGTTNMNGGGSNQINGSMIVARTRDASGNLLTSLESPVVNWNGGGGNGIRYDHCWADKMMAMIPYVPPPVMKPLVVLGTRTLNY